MKIPVSTALRFSVPFAFMTLGAIGCSNEPTGSSAATTSDTKPVSEMGAAADPDAMGNGSAATSDNSTETSAKKMTPHEERLATSNDMRVLRAQLINDLEAVRARLNVGTNPSPEREADQKLAAELAQGLERVDRALAAMDASDDMTWESMRESQLKEVAEVRVWMAGYKNNASAKK